mmetsp:Transcript_22295/g.54013  ORF Transcript_22295/g.54013 Transcript_22295/m.54013 type:complete len:442 (+) Transcript_22295:1-1326(+)
MTPLVAGNGAETVPSPTTSTHDAHHPTLRRIPSEESVHTVTALPGMMIRCHSIQHANSSGGGGRQRGEGVCNIRPSTTKAALRAVQLERRAARNRQRQHQNTTMQGGPQYHLGDNDPNNNISSSSSAFAMKESYWIDIETPRRSNDELYDFLRQLRLPPFFDSILSEPSNWTSEVIALRQVSLAIFQILPPDPNSDEITHVALLSMPRLLVTFSTFPQTDGGNAAAIDEGLYRLVSQYFKQRERVPEPSSTGLLQAWLQFHVRRTAVAIRELRLATVRMDEAMDRDFASFEFDQLVEAKNCLLRILSVAEEQHGTIQALAVAEQGTEGLDFNNCRGALSMLRANSSSNERLSSRVDKHLNELRERVMTYREDTLNQRLALLTILSAIFMPLTLLSGIWGMNFENMPELQMEGAYEKALLGMFLLALCMVYSFHRAGWSSNN